MSTPSRRDFVKAAVAATGAAVLLPGLAGASSANETSSASGMLSAEEHGWARVPSILARIKPPKFRARDFPVTRFGAKGDGTTDCTDAFKRAVAACSAAGGGRVLVTGGTFLTGPIHLMSRVNLYVAEG